jgi:hypothetical protein
VIPVSDDDGDDPFEELAEETEDREGDPFANLTPSQDDIPTTGEEPEVPDESPDEFEAETDVGPGVDDAGAGGDEEDDVSERKIDAQEAFPARDEDVDDFFDDLEGVEADPFEAPGSAFQRIDVEDIDADELWERLQRAQDGESVDDAAERTKRVVSKHEYCETCEHFSEPPQVRCSHEGTDIVEFTDIEHVMVLDCPIVANREELEQLHE